MKYTKADLPFFILLVLFVFGMGALFGIQHGEDRIKSELLDRYQYSIGHHRLPTYPYER
jgi:hypothetical protein